jgi:type IV secretory pathway TrbD component
MTLRALPIRRAGNRSSLFMGGDRELVMLSGVMAFALIFSAAELRLWFAALFVFRWMAKADPRMRQVYLRHRRYAAYYPPRATPFRENSNAQGRQYR